MVTSYTATERKLQRAFLIVAILITRKGDLFIIKMSRGGWQQGGLSFVHERWRFKSHSKSKPALHEYLEFPGTLPFIDTKNNPQLVAINPHKSNPCWLGSRSRRETFCLLLDFFIHLCLLMRKEWESMSCNLVFLAPFLFHFHDPMPKVEWVGRALDSLSIQMCFSPEKDKCQHMCVIILICFSRSIGT